MVLLFEAIFPPEFDFQQEQTGNAMMKNSLEKQHKFINNY